MLLKKILPLLFFSLLGSICLQAQASDKLLKRLPQTEGTLYFIKPLLLDQEDGKFELETDFTFSYQGTTDSCLVTMNFSVFGKKPIKNTHLLTVMGNDFNTTTLYVEKQKGKKWDTRLSAQLPLPIFIKLLEAQEDVSIVLKSKAKSLTFTADKKWYKITETLHTILEQEIQ